MKRSNDTRRRLVSASVPKPLVPFVGACALILACSSEATSDRDIAGEKTATNSAALSNPVLLSDGTHNFSETAAAVMITSQAALRQVATAIAANTDVDPTVFKWGCSNDGGNTFQTWSVTSPLTNNGDDPSMVWRSGTADNEMFFANMFDDTTGIRMFHTSDPCPTSGSGNIGWTDFQQLSGQVDYPRLIYVPNLDKLYISFTDETQQGLAQMRILSVGSDLHSGTVLSPNCTNNSAVTGAGEIAAAVDSNSVIHLIYNDDSGSIRHQAFDAKANKFQCTNGIDGPKGGTIGSIVPPGGTCINQPWHGQTISCRDTNDELQPPIPTYTGVDTQCLRGTLGASVAYNTQANSLIVTYDTPGGRCPDGTTKSETRFYTSTANPTLGASWTFSAVTGCQTSIQPTVVSTAGAIVHVMSSYVWPSDTQHRLAQVDWRSANGGNIPWIGNGDVAGSRSTPGPINPTSCAWGDYQAATYTFLTGLQYSWGQFDSNTNLWDVQGVYINP